MLVAENITKSFSGVTALQDVCLELHPGKVNAIIGENGAGKSTLMKILSGVYTEYQGKIVLNSVPVNFRNAKDAQEAGIAIIHQELNLVSELTVTENIFLGREITNSLGLLDQTRMYQKTKELLKRLHLNIDPSSKVASLKVGQQQVVEIAKALLLDASVIIMDEPTSAISESEVEVLFDIISKMKSEGKVIAYISHKLNELFRIADRFIVLRDGSVIESGEMKEVTADAIVQKMVGREIRTVRKVDNCSKTEVLLAVKETSTSFNLHKGEILGIFGLMGAGRTTLIESIFGLHQPIDIEINNNIKSIHSPLDAINAGVALVPEDRKKDGLILGLDVRANVCVTTFDDLKSFGLLDEKKETDLTSKYVNDLQIKVASQKQLVGTLSGGNQQKVVLAKWLATNPKVLMLDEPTRGIDVNAKNEIYKMILQLADEGLGIIMVSSELPEILAISDRILVMADGEITAEFEASEATESKILKQAMPKTT